MYRGTNEPEHTPSRPKFTLHFLHNFTNSFRTGKNPEAEDYEDEKS